MAIYSNISMLDMTVSNRKPTTIGLNNWMSQCHLSLSGISGKYFEQI
jgi:hypothetical protein